MSTTAKSLKETVTKAKNEALTSGDDAISFIQQNAKQSGNEYSVTYRGKKYKGTSLRHLIHQANHDGAFDAQQ